MEIDDKKIASFNKKIVDETAHEITETIKKIYEKDQFLIGTLISDENIVISMSDFSVCGVSNEFFLGATGAQPTQASRDLIYEVLRNLQKKIPDSLGFYPQIQFGLQRSTMSMGLRVNNIYWGQYPDLSSCQDLKNTRISLGNRYSKMKRISAREWHLQWMFFLSLDRSYLENQYNYFPNISEDRITIENSCNYKLKSIMLIKWQDDVETFDRDLRNADISIRSEISDFGGMLCKRFVSDDFTGVYHDFERFLKVDPDLQEMTISTGSPTGQFCFLSPSGRSMESLQNYLSQQKESYYARESEMDENLKKELSSRPFYVRLFEKISAHIEDLRKSYKN